MARLMCIFGANMTSLMGENILTTSSTTEVCSITHTLLFFIYLPMCLFGALINFGFLISILMCANSKSRNSLLINVIITDICVCIVSGFMTIAFYTNWPAWVMTSPDLAAFLQDVPVALSTLSMAVLSVDRYLTVKNHRNFSPFSGKSYAYEIIGVTWLLAFVISCVHFAPENMRNALRNGHMLIVYLMPACVIVLSHVAVYTRLTASSLTARAQHGELPLPMPLLRRPTNVIVLAGISKAGSSSEPPAVEEVIVEEPPVPNETSSLQSRRKLARSLILGAVLFVACWIPHVTAELFKEFSAEEWPTLSFFGFFAGHIYSIINPIMYYYFHRSLGNSSSIKSGRFFEKWGIRRSASSTNEAQLGPFNPKLIQMTPAKHLNRKKRPSSTSAFY